MKSYQFVLFFLLCTAVSAQDYFLQGYAPYDSSIPTPEDFLGYPIGDHHTRHDQMVAYLQKLADLSGTDDPHIDGFINKKNTDALKKSASIIISKVNSGRVILFAENPNFRGSWYGTNKLFLNGLFFGDKISVPN